MEILLLTFCEANAFSERFMKQYEEERAKLPYHINLLDIVGANEPKHSRILEQLFLYVSSDEKYALLNSFLQYIISKYRKGWHINIVKPIISAEQERIDLWVREPLKYSIIIENKIHFAADQPNQIARYIEKCNKAGFVNEQIYVLYLTRDGSKQPSTDTWLSPEGYNYADEYINRYLHVSYRYDILPWLKELPDFASKDEYLYQVVNQYIDHLEGMFNIRKIEKMMNDTLQKLLHHELHLTNDNHRENIATVTRKREDFNKIINYLSLLENEERKLSIPEYTQEWAERMRHDFQREPKSEGGNVYLSFSKNGKTFNAGITMEPTVTYYGISDGDATITEWSKSFGIVNACYDDPDGWNMYMYDDNEAVYENFRILINRIMMDI
jgi:hypothetical protein